MWAQHHVKPLQDHTMNHADFVLKAQNLIQVLLQRTTLFTTKVCASMSALGLSAMQATQLLASRAGQLVSVCR